MVPPEARVASTSSIKQYNLRLLGKDDVNFSKACEFVVGKAEELNSGMPFVWGYPIVYAFWHLNSIAGDENSRFK